MTNLPIGLDVVKEMAVATRASRYGFHLNRYKLYYPNRGRAVKASRMLTEKGWSNVREDHTITLVLSDPQGPPEYSELGPLHPYDPGDTLKQHKAATTSKTRTAFPGSYITTQNGLEPNILTFQVNDLGSPFHGIHRLDRNEADVYEFHKMLKAAGIVCLDPQAGGRRKKGKKSLQKDDLWGDAEV